VKQLEEDLILDYSFFYIFTNKVLFIEFCLGITKSIMLKLLFLKAKYEADTYAETSKTFDLRKAPLSFKRVLIEDQSILDYRWDLCKGCEFLRDDNRCLKCGCWMTVKYKISTARCPIGKWDRVNTKEQNVVKPAPQI